MRSKSYILDIRNDVPSSDKFATVKGVNNYNATFKDYEEEFVFRTQNHLRTAEEFVRNFKKKQSGINFVDVRI